MDDGFLVHILKTHTDLFYYCCCLFFWQFFLLFDLLETTVGKCFDDQIEIFLIVEVSEQCSQIGMVQIGLDLDLSQNVIFYLHLTDSLLRHLLYHANKADVLLLGHEDLSECTLA